MDSVLVLESEITTKQSNNSDIHIVIYKNIFASLDFQKEQVLVEIYNTNYDNNELVISFLMKPSSVVPLYNKFIVMNENYIIIYIRPSDVCILNLESLEYKLFDFSYEVTGDRYALGYINNITHFI
jgi:hypothetical protein